jgi:hypothetical protein
LGSRPLIPSESIGDPDVRRLADEAVEFLRRHPWCASISSCEVAWAVPGVVGVFLMRHVPSREAVDELLWVVVGDLPSAYLVLDEAPTWFESLQGYVHEMDKWVSAVRKNESVSNLIPVNVPATRENVDLLARRLEFIRIEILARNDDSAGGNA